MIRPVAGRWCGSSARLSYDGFNNLASETEEQKILGD